MVWSFYQSYDYSGYKQGNGDHTIFVKCRSNKITALIVYVDDIIIIGDDVERKASLKILWKEFEMKELGDLSLVLRWQNQKKELCYHNKSMYWFNNWFGMLGCKPANTPI